MSTSGENLSGVNLCEGSPLSLAEAAAAGNDELLNVLLKVPGVDPNVGTPLFNAVAMGYKKCVRALLQNVLTDVNSSGSGGGHAPANCLQRRAS